MSQRMIHRMISLIYVCVFFSCIGMQEDMLLDKSILQGICYYNIDQNSAYIEVERKPLIVLFSGCAGMGKSTLAQEMQQTHKMMLFDAYENRVQLKEKYNAFHVDLPVEEKVNKFLSCFNYFLIEVKKSISNKAIIFDESIDRKEPPLYEKIAYIAQSRAFPLCVIRLEVPRALAFKRLMDRECNNDESKKHFEQHFNAYYDVYESFDTSRVHYFVTNDTESQPPLMNSALSEYIAEKVNP